MLDSKTPEIQNRRGRGSSSNLAAKVEPQSSETHDDPGMELVSLTKKVEEGEGPWLVSYADMMTLLMGFFALIASFSKPDVKEFEKVQQSAAEHFGGEFQKPYEELTKKIQKIVDENNLQNKVEVTREADGVSIRFDGQIFFDSGEFIVKNDGKAAMDKLLVGLGQDIHGHRALIEGHTDNAPIRHTIIASNWELSGIRAARIAQIFETHGFGKEQITILGWGETKPLVPNEDTNKVPIPNNQAKNRRVLIKLSKTL